MFHVPNPQALAPTPRPHASLTRRTQLQVLGPTHRAGPRTRAAERQAQLQIRIIRHRERRISRVLEGGRGPPQRQHTRRHRPIPRTFSVSFLILVLDLSHCQRPICSAGTPSQREGRWRVTLRRAAWIRPTVSGTSRAAATSGALTRGRPPAMFLFSSAAFPRRKSTKQVRQVVSKLRLQRARRR
jgi:hypothetical protein